MVSDKVRDHLINHHELASGTALQIAVGARERATIDLVDQAGRTADMERFVAHLNEQGRLTPSLMLRALAHGHMGFFEWGLSELAKVPHHRTWLMIHDAGPLGLRAIYERAGLPVRLFPGLPGGGGHLPLDGVRRRPARPGALPGADAGALPHPAHRPRRARTSTTCSRRWTAPKRRRRSCPPAARWPVRGRIANASWRHVRQRAGCGGTHAVAHQTSVRRSVSANRF